MRYFLGGLVGAAIAVAVNIALVMRAVNDTSNAYAGENALGYALIPFAAIVGAAIGVTVTMVWLGSRKGRQTPT